MQVRNHDVSVIRGESWTLSKLIENRDGSPYIISSRFKNPHWLVTVTSARYNQINRYFLNKWLELKNLPRFEITQPVKLKSIDENYNFDNMNIPAGYEGDKMLGYANKAIFYDESPEGVTSYKYWEYNNNDKDNFDGKWVDYYCPIITTFNTDITNQWVEQNYLYSILLVDGDEVIHNENERPITVENVYNILEPTKLYVKSNLKGGLI